MQTCNIKRCQKCAKFMPFIKLHCNGCVSEDCCVPKCIQQRELMNNQSV